MARKGGKSGSKKRRRKGREGRVGRVAVRDGDRFFTRPKTTDDHLAEMGVTRKELENYLDALAEWAPDLGVDEAIWVTELIGDCESEDLFRERFHEQGVSPKDAASIVALEAMSKINQRFDDPKKQQQAEKLFYQYTRDARLGNIDPPDAWKAALMAVKTQKEATAKGLDPEDLAWADAVTFPETDDPMTIHRFIIDHIGHRFGGDNEDAAWTEELAPRAKHTADYLTARIKAELLRKKAQHQLGAEEENVRAVLEALKDKLREAYAKDGNPMTEEELSVFAKHMMDMSPAMTLEDIAWIAQTGANFTDASTVIKAIEERFSGRVDGQEMADQAVKLMVSGRLGRTKAARKELAELDASRLKATEPTEPGGQASLLEEASKFLTKTEGRVLIEELREVGQRCVAHALDPNNGGYRRGLDGVTKIVKGYLRKCSRNIQKRYPHLTREQLQIVLDYSRDSLERFINETGIHLHNVERMTEVLHPDEFDLFVYLYQNKEEPDPLVYYPQNEDEPGDFTTKVCAWYEDRKGDELEALLKLIGDFEKAVKFFESLQVVLDLHRGFLPTPPSRKSGRAAVRHYLRCLSESYDFANTEQDNRSARLIWAALRNARVFEISAPIFSAIFAEVQRYIWTKVCELPVERMGTNPVAASLTKEESAKAHEAICDAADRLPIFDDIMPFDHIFVGFDGEGQLTDAMSTREKLADHAQPEKILRSRILGYLIGPVHGTRVEAIEFVRITAPGGIDNVVAIASHLAPGLDVNGVDRGSTWMHPWHQTPWIINSILSFIHEHKTLVLEQHMSKQQRRVVGKQAKAKGFDIIPRPYYLVPLKNLTMKSVARRSVGFVARRAPLSYRHDRRGHERVYVQRGPLPLDDKKRKDLEKPRGVPPMAYTIYTVTDPNAEHARLLMERRQLPKREGEWVAIKVRHIDQTIIGDGSLPYVPGVRVSTDREVQRRLRKRADHEPDDRPPVSP